jgi:hypothetical protein
MARGFFMRCGLVRTPQTSRPYSVARLREIAAAPRGHAPHSGDGPTGSVLTKAFLSKKLMPVCETKFVVMRIK